MCVADEIQTEHLPSRTQKRYRYTETNGPMHTRIGPLTGVSNMLLPYEAISPLLTFECATCTVI
jgi:hypothetical protein